MDWAENKENDGILPLSFPFVCFPGGFERLGMAYCGGGVVSLRLIKRFLYLTNNQPLSLLLLRFESFKQRQSCRTTLVQDFRVTKLWRPPHRMASRPLRPDSITKVGLQPWVRGNGHADDK